MFLLLDFPIQNNDYRRQSGVIIISRINLESEMCMVWKTGGITFSEVQRIGRAKK
jgi:hypothetical protein